MLNSQASAATPGQILPPKSCANTAAATSGAAQWLDVRGYKGELLVVQVVGAVTGTGSLAGKLQSATDVNGTGAGDIVGSTFPTVTIDTNAITAGSVGKATESISVDPRKVAGGFLGYVGTIAGANPVLLAVAVAGKKG
jgi:hypothetical protein